MRATLLLLTTCLVAPLLPAQPDAGRAQDWRKAQIRKKVEEMRRAMREGRIVRYNVRVKVRLKNGSRMKGIVRNGRFIEKHDGLDFVVTDKRSAHAGLRLWYYNGTNSYIFLSHASIAHYRLGNRMTDGQIRDLERRLMEAERERRELERRLLEDRRRRAAADAGPEAGPDGGKAAAPLDTASAEAKQYGRTLTDTERKLLKWLEEFSPEQGWGKKKLRDLQVRRITVGVYPNKEEKRFEQNFDEWAKALEFMEKLTAAMQGNQGTGGENSGAQGYEEPPPRSANKPGVGK